MMWLAKWFSVIGLFYIVMAGQDYFVAVSVVGVMTVGLLDGGGL